MHTVSFIVYIKTDNNYKDTSEGVETRYDALNYEVERSLPKGKKQKRNWVNVR